jgi:hypothetical protein
MNVIAEIFRTLGRIEVLLEDIRQTSQRVTMIQRIQSRVRRGWALVMTAWICLLQRAWGKP